MKKIVSLTLLVLTTGLLAAADPSPQWKQIWCEEFNAPSGSLPDPARWKYDTGGHGFGNHELQYHTVRPENVVIEDGNLVIWARQEKFTGPDGVSRDYTSGRIHTAEGFTQKYGRFEARIKIPQGAGMWPAFWMLGDDRPTRGWPKCGEIDIMENVGFEPSSVHGTLHGPGYSGAKGITSTFKLPQGQKFSDDFHLFGTEWSPDKISFTVDGQCYKTMTRDDLPPGTQWVFDHPFYIILNLAVGGDWPGPPDQQTIFPQKMLVDYVRTYQVISQ